MKPLGIERQALMVALIPILIMAVLLENYFVYARFSDQESALLERSQMMARQIALSSEYGVFSGNTAMLQQNVDATLAQQDVNKVVVLDAAAKPLIEKNEERGLYVTLLAKANTSTPVYQDEDVLVLYEPVVATQIKLNELDLGVEAQPAANKPLGTVIIEVSKHRLKGQKHEILLFSLAITLLIFVVTIMVALWAARRITLPIMGMSQAINRIGKGNLDTRVSPQPKILELSELATGVNQMAQQLQREREILENRIAARTAALAASEQESRTLIENTPDTIARYDLDCRRTYVNAAFAAMVEGGAASLLGKKPSECPGGPNSDIYETQIKQVIASGENIQFELKWPNKDGKEIYSHIRLTAERDLSGSISSVLGVGRDITELNESRDELRRKEQAKSRFLAAAGHDLRQPLAAANLFIDALKFTDPSADQNQIIQRLDQAMVNFNGLLEALLNMSKLDAGIVKPEYISINVAEIVNWLEQSLAPMAREKKLGFKVFFTMKNMLVIHSDIDLIKSVLMNLVSNAIKYTAKGAILISARQRGDDVLFQVWDTGIGIKAEHVKQIFDEFYQVDNPQRNRTGGLGLGLSIAKRSLALLGGEITCRSQLGHGSVFEFSLPLDNLSNNTIQETTTVKSEQAEISRSFVRGKRFVVVEDDAMVAEALSKSLGLMGGEVECFDNAEYALQQAHIGNADCYIVDYMLPGNIDGINFLLRLRQNLHKPVCAVMMSGDTSSYFIRKAELFDWPVLHKPVNISKLITRLSEQYGKTV